MKLLSLPDEMLYNVLKFSKFETVTRLRRKNVRIDKIAVAYEVNKPKCFFIEAERERLVIVYKTKDREVHPTNRYSQKALYFQCSDPSHMAETTLKKVRGIKALRIYRLDVDMGWLELLDSVKQRHRIEVTLMDCEYNVSLDDLKKVLRKFKTVEFYTTTQLVVREGRVITDKVACSILSFASLIIGTGERQQKFQEITDETLKILQTALPSDFSIYGHSANFTLSEVIKTFKIAILNPSEPPRGWDFGTVKVNSRYELDKAFNEFSSIEGIRITIDRAESLSLSVRFIPRHSYRGYWVIIEM